VPYIYVFPQTAQARPCQARRESKQTQTFKTSGKYKGEKPDFIIYGNVKREGYHTNSNLGDAKELTGTNETQFHLVDRDGSFAFSGFQVPHHADFVTARTAS